MHYNKREKKKKWNNKEHMKKHEEHVYTGCPRSNILLKPFPFDLALLKKTLYRFDTNSIQRSLFWINNSVEPPSRPSHFIFLFDSMIFEMYLVILSEPRCTRIKMCIENWIFHKWIFHTHIDTHIHSKTSHIVYVLCVCAGTYHYVSFWFYNSKLN